MSETPWVMRMRWLDLLFAHWPVPVETLRPLIPAGLEVDTFEGRAWLGIVPFRMEDVAPRFLPAVPGPGAFPELNVRTYVRWRGRGAVWFLSLDAAAGWPSPAPGPLPPAVLPRPHVVRDRGGLGGVPLGADGPARAGGRLRRPLPPDRAGRARRARLPGRVPDRPARPVRRRPRRTPGLDRDPHAPWPLQPAEAEIRVDTMAAAHGITLPDVDPVLYFAKRLDVVAWWPRRLPSA